MHFNVRLRLTLAHACTLQGVLVALVPEGLPLALAAGLTIIAKRLCDKHGVLLKQLATVETIGSMSMLASDKTGTLTQVGGVYGVPSLIRSCDRPGMPFSPCRTSCR